MSGAHRWIKFWPQDWQRDPALRSCGVAARGLWIDLICIMHEGCPYGHLTIGGKPASERQIGTLTGSGEKEAVKLLAELEDAGVFSRTGDGTIYSRRMVRDNLASEEGRKAGKRGGNPALNPSNAAPVNGSGNPEGLTPPVNQETYDPPQTLTSEFKKHKELPSLRSGSGHATRLPDDWQPDPEARQFAREADLDPDFLADRFRDYWRAKAGRDGFKADWDATWRNWCRTEITTRSAKKAPSSDNKTGRRAAFAILPFGQVG